MFNGTLVLALDVRVKGNEFILKMEDKKVKKKYNSISFIKPMKKK